MLNCNVVFHPTDFSAHSKEAFRYACSLARDNNAGLVVAHVTAPLMSPVPAGIATASEDGIDDYRQSLQQHLKANQPPSDYALKTEYRLREGDVVEEVLNLADEVKADLIVMGTHGRTGLGRLFMGSTAEQTLRHAKCPVLTVKLPEGSEEHQSGTEEETDRSEEWKAVTEAMRVPHS